MYRCIPVLRQNIADLLVIQQRPQLELAEYLNHNRSWLSKFLRGHRSEISIGDLDRIAAFFGIEVFQLFIRSRERPVAVFGSYFAPNGRKRTGWGAFRGKQLPRGQHRGKVIGWRGPKDSA